MVKGINEAFYTLKKEYLESDKIELYKNEEMKRESF